MPGLSTPWGRDQHLLCYPAVCCCRALVLDFLLECPQEALVPLFNGMLGK